MTDADDRTSPTEALQSIAGYLSEDAQQVVLRYIPYFVQQVDREAQSFGRLLREHMDKRVRKAFGDTCPALDASIQHIQDTNAAQRATVDHSKKDAQCADRRLEELRDRAEAFRSAWTLRQDVEKHTRALRVHVGAFRAEHGDDLDVAVAGVEAFFAAWSSGVVILLRSEHPQSSEEQVERAVAADRAIVESREELANAVADLVKIGREDRGFTLPHLQRRIASVIGKAQAVREGVAAVEQVLGNASQEQIIRTVKETASQGVDAVRSLTKEGVTEQPDVGDHLRTLKSVLQRLQQEGLHVPQFPLMASNEVTSSDPKSDAGEEQFDVHDPESFRQIGVIGRWLEGAQWLDFLDCGIGADAAKDLARRVALHSASIDECTETAEALRADMNSYQERTKNLQKAAERVMKAIDDFETAVDETRLQQPLRELLNTIDKAADVIPCFKDRAVELRRHVDKIEDKLAIVRGNKKSLVEGVSQTIQDGFAATGLDMLGGSSSADSAKEKSTKAKPATSNHVEATSTKATPKAIAFGFTSTATEGRTGHNAETQHVRAA